MYLRTIRIPVCVLCVFAMILLMPGCSSHEDSRKYPLDPSMNSGQLPGLPDEAAARSASEVMQHQFSMPDEVDSDNASWDDLLLSLDETALSWSIVGLDIDDEPPLSIQLSGTLDGLYVAVSDYGNARWRYIGNDLSDDSLISVPDGEFTNSSGSIFFALIAPQGSAAEFAATLSYGIPSSDTTPPVWTGGEGIISVGASTYIVQLEWHEASDEESPPVEYLIFQADSNEGIDWNNHQYVVPVGFLTTGIRVPDGSTSLYDYAVRARDAAGNVTANENFISASFSGSYTTPITDWLPGDSIEVSWQDPLKNGRLRLIAPDFMEGSPDEPEELAGVVSFSPDHESSGMAFESGDLQVAAPEGGYLMELGVGGFETYVIRLMDSDGALKQHLGNYTTGDIFAGGIDYVYLRHGTDSWPQRSLVNADERLEISWADPELDVSLWVMSPGYEQGSPAFPDDLVDRLEFSQENLVSNIADEWIGFRENADPGEYGFAISWDHSEAQNPAQITVNWVVRDELDNIVMGPGSVVLKDRGESFFVDYLDPFFWLEYQPAAL